APARGRAGARRESRAPPSRGTRADSAARSCRSVPWPESSRVGPCLRGRRLVTEARLTGRQACPTVREPPSWWVERMPTPPEPLTSPRRGKSGEWDAGAAVRTKPRRRLSEAGGKDFYFAPGLVPVAGHPLVVTLGPAAIRRVLIEHLQTHLVFTERLEHDCVNATL